MIQRRQTLYLLLGILSLVAMFFFDSFRDVEDAGTPAWFEPLLLGLGILVLLCALVSVFLYRNRERQQQTVVGTQVLLLFFMVVLFGGLFLSGALESMPASNATWPAYVGLALPVIAYVFFFLARRRIQADIALVRSMDRLR